MTQPTCETCRFWRDSGRDVQTIGRALHAKQGICRKNAPVADPGMGGYAIWAMTKSLDWCGEHEPKKAE